MAKVENNIDDSEHWVDEHGDALFRYALSRLHNHASAEDVVQETFLAAILAKKSFSGKSSIQAWLLGILKHKIIDRIRSECKTDVFDTLVEPEDAETEEFFDKKGRWRVKPADWQINPRKILEQKEFIEVLNNCLERLPKRLRRIFVLRELENQNSKEICKDLEVSATNLWVMLHRGRMRLRNCLSLNWFDIPKKEEGS